MNKDEFIELTLKPSLISEKHINGLEVILEEFPYFQAARILHLKGLKKQKNIKYNNTLKKVAAYTTNRTVLFDFITTDALNYDAFVKKEAHWINNLEVFESEIIEFSEKHDTEQNEDTVIPDAFQVKRLLQIENELAIGKPINFDKKDEFSFNEWLDVTPPKPIARKNDEKNKKNELNSTKSKLSKQVNLIEKFIAKKPKVRPSKSQKIKDIAIESVVENTSLMTETLARVYIEQKKYDKAIAAFKILSLKYPKKSSFFAEKIKAIKYLQNNKS